MQKRPIELMIIVCIISTCSSIAMDIKEYNGTGFIIMYDFEHIKGEQYTIYFTKENIGTIEWEYSPVEFQIGDSTSNSTHMWYDYEVFLGTGGGTYQFELIVYDLNSDVLEHVFIQVHVYLDYEDEQKYQKEIDAKDGIIQGLQDDNNKKDQLLQNVSETPTDPITVFKNKTHINEPFVPWFYALLTMSTIGYIHMRRSAHLEEQTDITSDMISVVEGISITKMTFEDSDKLLYYARERYEIIEPEVLNLNPDPLTAWISAFEPVPYKVFVIIDEKVAKEMGIQIIDKTLKERLNRFRTSYNDKRVSEAWDKWIGVVKYKLMPLCILFKSDFGDNMEELKEILKEWEKESQNEEETPSKTSKSIAEKAREIRRKKEEKQDNEDKKE